MKKVIKDGKKVIRDGKVAVLISEKYGAGWYTWNRLVENKKELLFNPKLVEMVEKNRLGEINKDWIEKNIGIKNVFTGGVNDLTIEWVSIGSEFIVYDIDGFESIELNNGIWLIA